MAKNKKRKAALKTSSESIYQLKATLLGSEPPVWRRIQVPGTATLEELHYIIQCIMGWECCHLHQFDVGGVMYSDAEYGLEGARPGHRVTLQEAVPTQGMAFGYVYDFGDNWEHGIVVEEILTRHEGEHFPVCIDGERACPPEDCGGVWGYENFLAAIADPGHQDHEDLLDWIGGSFDAETFDVGKVNSELKRLKLDHAK